MDPLRGASAKEKIRLAPAQGPHAHIECVYNMYIRKEFVSFPSVSVHFVSCTWPFRFDSFPLPGCFGSIRFLNITSRFGPFRPEPGRFVAIRFL